MLRGLLSAKCEVQPVTGPPGTGMTCAIVSMVEMVLGTLPDARFLLTSRTNTACDELLDAVNEFVCSLTAPGRHDDAKTDGVTVFRVGEPPPADHRARAEHIDVVVEERHLVAYPSVTAAVERARARVAHAHGRVDGASAAGAEPGAGRSPKRIEESLYEEQALEAAVRRQQHSDQELRKRIVRGAFINFTTASTLTGGLVGRQGFDATIIDDGAATSVPASVATSVRAKWAWRAGESSDEEDGHPAERTKGIVIVGDDAQLGPSAGLEYRGETRPLTCSVFERLARLITACVILSVQYRMRPLMWSLL